MTFDKLRLSGVGFGDKRRASAIDTIAKKKEKGPKKERKGDHADSTDQAPSPLNLSLSKATRNASLAR
ncbi:MAG: hypothetical protein WCY29_00810 [Novosphingobium sp.]